MSPQSDISGILDQFCRMKVLIVGDVMLDRYLYGKVNRISPEAPVPVVEWGSEEERVGGAGNVAINVRSLGARAFLCAVVGKDREGSALCDLLTKEGIDHHGVIQLSGRPTTIKTRVIAGNQHLLRLDKESVEDLGQEEEAHLIGRISTLLSAEAIDVVILQDYNKGVLTENVISFVLERAKALGIPVTVDPKHKNFWCYKGIELLKPNLKEVREILRFPVVADEGSLRRATSAIREKLSNTYCLITLSERGIYMDDSTRGVMYPTQTRNVADVCGAGDGVISVAALGLAAGLSMEQISRLSNLAGGQIVESVGVVPVDSKRLAVEGRGQE